MTAREARVLMGLYLYWQSQQQMARGQSPFHGNGNSQPIYLREKLVLSLVEAPVESQTDIAGEPPACPKPGGGPA